MLTNSIFGNCNTCGNCSTCGCSSCNGVLGTSTGCGCGCNTWGNNLGCSAFNFVGDWVNIVVTLTILQSILGLVCNWNCGCNN